MSWLSHIVIIVIAIARHIHGMKYQLNLRDIYISIRRSELHTLAI